MIILSPAQEAREMLRARLQQIAVHSSVDFVRRAAEQALLQFNTTSVVYVMQLSVQCEYRDGLIDDFNTCRSAGGFDVDA